MLRPTNCRLVDHSLTDLVIQAYVGWIILSLLRTLKVLNVMQVSFHF